jgi:hypothetical protein
MDDSRSSSGPGSPPSAPETTPAAKTPLKNIAYFVGSMAAAYVIIQVVKLFVHPWLVANGLWPF